MSWTHTRSKIAHAKRRDPDSDVTELRRQLRAERLAEHVERVVNEAPPLTEDQLDRIAAILRPTLRRGSPPRPPAAQVAAPAQAPTCETKNEALTKSSEAGGGVGA